MSLIKKVAVLFAIFVLLISGCVALTFLNVGTWLVVSDRIPPELDVVFTFAGENVRVTYSRELVLNNPTSHWVLSDYKNGYARLLRKDGFDMHRVSPVDTCSNTFSEVDALHNWLKKNRIEGRKLNVGLVSGPYHMRRIKFMVNRTFHDKSFQFYYLPVPLERYRWNKSTFRKWWELPEVRNVVKSEIEKILYFWLLS